MSEWHSATSHPPQDGPVQLRRRRAESDLEGAAVQIVAGLMAGAGTVAALLLPLPIAAARLGPNLGVAVGCFASVLVQVGILGLAGLAPSSTGAVLARAICGKGIPLMTVFAPIGVTIAWIPDRQTATWTGVGIGLAVVILGWLLLRLLPHRLRWFSPRVGKHDAAASAAAGAGLLAQHTTDASSGDGGA